MKEFMNFWRKLFGKFNRKKMILGVLTGILVFGILGGVFAPQGVLATPPAGDTIASAGFSGFLILELATKILTSIAALVDFATRFGDDILNLPAVQSGWKIMLNLTNLGFVLAIIVIAFATIFRMESYALKQTLWKLIVAALLVNFSLVIAGAFMSASGIVSNVFYDAALGNGGENLSNALANAMAPQKLGEVKSLAENALEWAKGFIPYSDANIKYFINILFIIIFTVLTILAFATLFIMLFIRAIALAFLLILSPIVWLFWVLPATQKYWHQWWQEFLRWNFFAPAVYFFIYLSVLTASKIQKEPLSAVTGALGTSEKTAAAVFNKEGYMSDIFTHAANLFVVLALLYGGIYIANKFGIAGGSIGVNLAQKAGEGIAGWTRRGAKNWGRAGYSAIAQKAGLKEKSENLSKKAAASKGLKRLAYSWMGRGVATLSAGAEREPKKYEQKYKGMTTRQIMAALPATFGAEKATALKELVNRPDIPLKKKERAQYLAQVGVNDDGKNIFTGYGMDVDFSGVEKKSGMSAAMGTALNNNNIKGFVEATREFIKGLKKKDAPDVFKAFKHFFDDPTFKINNTDEITVGDHIADVLVSKNPAIMPAGVSHLGGFDVVEKFNKAIEQSFNWWKTKPDEWQTSSGTDPTEINRRQKKWEKSLYHFATSEWTGAEEEKKGEEKVVEKPTPPPTSG